MLPLEPEWLENEDLSALTDTQLAQLEGELNELGFRVYNARQLVGETLRERHAPPVCASYEDTSPKPLPIPASLSLAERIARALAGGVDPSKVTKLLAHLNGSDNE